MKNKIVVILGAIALAASANVAIGSGSYTSRPPRPGVEKKSLDHAKYALGQRIFDGKMRLQAAQSDATAQKERLKALQARLPERVAKKKALVGLAGKLASDQLEALEYYVNQRFGR